MEWVAQCSDDLISLAHPVRTVAAVVARLDLSAFGEAIQAREGVAGRDATDPELLVGLWLYGCIRGIGSARELARRCEESVPFRWLCGGVSVNHRMLSEFRTDPGAALDQLFTQVIASLVDKELVSVSRMRSGWSAGASQRGGRELAAGRRLGQLLVESRRHVEELKRQIEEPEQLAGEAARKKAAQRRAAEEKQKRVEQALAQLPELKRQLENRAERAGQGRYGEKIRSQELRVSSSDAASARDADAERRHDPAFNVQLAAVPHTARSWGSRSATRATMRRGRRSDARTGGAAQREEGAAAAVGRGLLPQPGHRARARSRGRVVRTAEGSAAAGEWRPRAEPKPQDSEALRAWKQRMASDEGQKIYRQRAATSETVNADLRTYRGLTQFTVRGLYKARCVALWCALAYNVMHFSGALLH